MTLRPGRLAWLACAGWLLVGLSMARADDPAPPAQGDSRAQPLGELEDAPETLKAEPPSEEKQDRLHAASLFAQGRILYQRGKYAEALAKYERAWRYDQDSQTILEEVTPLALRLNRFGEAARYALLAVEKGAKVDPRTLQTLAMQLSQDQEWKDARTLYQKYYELQKAAPGQDDALDFNMIVVLLELGRMNFLLGDFRASAEAFAPVWDAIQHPDKFNLNADLRKMILDDPERTYMLLGEAFVRGGRPDDAEAVYRQAEADKPQPELLDYRLARVAAARDKPDEAFALLEKYFQAKSSLAAAAPYELLAELLEKKHVEKQEAQQQLLDRLEKLYADDPANPGLAYYTADQYLAADRLEDAEKIYREQLVLNPSVEGYAGLLAVYCRMERPEPLLDILGQAAAEDGSLEGYDAEVAEIAKNEKLLDQLIAAAREKKKVGPDALGDGGSLAIGLVALEGKRIDAANEFLELAARRHEPGPAAVYSAWGLGLFFHERYDQAAEIFQRAIDEQVRPENNAAFYFYLANALAYADRPDEALTAALQAAQLRPDNPRFESRAAWINYRAQRYGDAERAYLDLLAKIQDDYGSDPMRDLVREAKLILSNICVKQDRFDDGVEWLEQVLDEYPRDAGALNDLGYLWAEKGIRLQRALKMVQTAVEADPDNAAYQDSLGWALFRLGRTEEALRRLEKAVELQGDKADGVILDHLGDVYQALGHHDQALDAWRRAAAAFEQADDTDELEKTRKKLEATP